MAMWQVEEANEEGCCMMHMCPRGNTWAWVAPLPQVVVSSHVSWRETAATAATTWWSNLLLWVAKESALAPNVRFGDQNAELPGQFDEKQVV